MENTAADLIVLDPFQEHHCVCEYLHAQAIVTRSALILGFFPVRCLVDCNTYRQAFAPSLVQSKSYHIRTLLDSLWLLLVSFQYTGVFRWTQLTFRILLSAIMKIYALFTLHETGWGTRAGIGDRKFTSQGNPSDQNSNLICLASLSCNRSRCGRTRKDEPACLPLHGSARSLRRAPFASSIPSIFKFTSRL